MKAIWICVLTLCILWPQRHLFAQDSSFGASLSWGVNVYDDINGQSDSNEMDTSTLAPVTLQTSREVSDQGTAAYDIYSDTANISYGGHAQVGVIGVDIGGTASTSNQAIDRIQTTASALGQVTASWNDFDTIESESLAPNTPLVITASVVLSGSLGGDGSGYYPLIPQGHTAGWQTVATITGLGDLATDEAGNSTMITDTAAGNILGDIFSENEDETIILKYVVGNGEAEAIGYELSASGTTTVTALTIPGTATGYFAALFNDTLSWGGITSVTLMDGTPIPSSDWTNTSASGLDYSQPFPVPEPSTLPMVAIGGLVLASRKTRIVKTASPSIAGFSS